MTPYCNNRKAIARTRKVWRRHGYTMKRYLLEQRAREARRQSDYHPSQSCDTAP